MYDLQGFLKVGLPPLCLSQSYNFLRGLLFELGVYQPEVLDLIQRIMHLSFHLIDPEHHINEVLELCCDLRVQSDLNQVKMSIHL